MYSVAAKSWWALHSWLIEDLLWDFFEACIVEFLGEAGLFYLIWMATYPVQLFILINLQLTKFSTWIDPHYIATPPG